MSPGVLHVVLPGGVGDPRERSGGDLYDRRVCEGLVALGWSVVEHPVPEQRSAAGRASRELLHALDDVLTAVADDGLVLVDGLVASGSRAPMLRHSDRLRLVVLVHLPFGVGTPSARPDESAVLAACAAVVTTSVWTRSWLLAHYPLDPGRVRAVRPGAEPAAQAPATASGGSLLVVGRVTEAKGYDVLAAALSGMTRHRGMPWRCTCIGSLESDPDFVAHLRGQLVAARLAERVRLRGALAPDEVGEAYAGADLLVVPSRMETYGMVVTEALAHGVPVVASDVGGAAEALGHAPDGRRPGVLVPPGGVPALEGALWCWLASPQLRAALRVAARARRTTLAGWPAASARLGAVLRRARG